MSTQSRAAASHDEFNRNSLFNMKGRVALVTGSETYALHSPGAGTGIGLMATQALAVNGAKVYIAGRSTDKLDNVVETYGRDIEGEIIPLQGDVTDKADVARLAAELARREECLCILVNNAGVSSASLTTETEAAGLQAAEELRRNLFDTDKTTLEDWVDVYRTNVASVFFVTTALLPLLQKSSERHDGWSGTVINITSISGLIKSAQHHFSYNASKGAAVQLTRMLAAEVANSGLKVRINSIAPGVFPSEMTTKEESDEYQKSHIPKEKYADKVPAARPGRDEDMAQAVLFLAANQYLNGQTVAVDGGYTLAAGM
ncbi:uncharacterized protein E0L32_001167 [Thyridium curvatum]|uniref:Uncharacterized protein n=1 Tax=Thyridium curvatum TaxID=1093900 RepID=A0A507B237_9PEZI|nr:uncharacterized protein E0L32_001167 [Thyridium curvatum]TPX11349.1 hypothetical protein E0L32_001167 [Thyridium curvatum]